MIIKEIFSSRAANNSVPQIETIDTVRSELVNSTVFAIAILGIPTIIASLYRMLEIGWQPVLIVLYVGSYLPILGTAILHRRLSFSLRAFVVLAALLLSGSGALLTWGLIGVGVFFFVTASILATIFWGTRAGILVLALALAIMGLVSMGIYLGQVSFDFDLMIFATAPSSWIARMVGVGFFTFIILASLGKFHETLVAFIRILHQRTSDLQHTNEQLHRANHKLTREINERKQAEDALRVEKKFNESMLDAVVDTIFVHDPKTLKPLRWNKALNEISGYTDEEILAKKAIEDWYREEELAQIRAEGEKRILRGEKVIAELSLITKHGKLVPLEYSASLIKDAEGNPQYIISVGRNITKRKQAEETLRRYADRLEVLHQIEQGILAAHSSEAIAQAAVTRIRQLVPCRRVTVTLFDYAIEEIYILAVDPDTEMQAARGIREHTNLFKDVIEGLRQDRICTWGNLRSRGRIGQDLYAEGVQLVISIPLISQEELIGSLNLEMGESGDLTKEQANTVRQVAGQLAIAIRQVRLHEQVQHHAAELEQRVADRTRELSALYDVTAVAGEALNLDTTLKQLLERVLAAMQSDIGAIHLKHEGGETLRLAALQGLPLDLATQIEAMPKGDNLTAWVIEHGEPLIVPDITADPRIPPIPGLPPLTYVGVPIRTRGQVLGVLSVAKDKQQPPFNMDQITLLISIADHVGIVVESALLRQRVEQTAVLEERERLARELHDSITQSLYSLTLFAEWERDLLEDGELEEAKQRIIRIGETAQQALKEMRLLVYELRPALLEQDGLMGALQRRLDAVEKRAGVEVSLQAEPFDRLPAPVEQGLYRIAQEALNNALKHAAASRVTVCIEIDGERVTLEVEDDGVGFIPDAISDKGGLGMASMRERAKRLGGELSVVSSSGQGTKVKVTMEVS